MADTKCKTCRRAGEKLFLKGERCHTPKCAAVRKPYPPGVHGHNRQRKLSEYGLQLRQKQLVKSLYGISEQQFHNTVAEAVRTPHVNTIEQLYRLLELRLDNVVFRLGFAFSRSLARQIVSHGHMTVNGRRVTIPSYRLRANDRVAIRKESLPKGMFQDIEALLKTHEPPVWTSLDRTVKSGLIAGQPTIEEERIRPQLNTVVAFYAR